MGTLRSRGQNEQKRRETNAKGGSTKYQTIVFQKQNGVGSQEFHSRYPPLYTPPFSFPSLCSRALTSLLTCGGPRHSQNSWLKYKLHRNGHSRMYTHRETLCFHRLKAWERCVLAGLLVPGTETSRGFPSLVLREGRCSCVGVLEMFGLHGTGSILLPFIVTDWAWTRTTIQSKNKTCGGVGEPRVKGRRQGVCFLLQCVDVNPRSIPWRITEQGIPILSGTDRGKETERVSVFLSVFVYWFLSGRAWTCLDKSRMNKNNMMH